MATKAIVTSHPEVICEICERRLLRGERPEAFLAAESVCTVCELCVPRARAAGWSRLEQSAEGWEAHQPGARAGKMLPALRTRLRALRARRSGDRDSAPITAEANGAGGLAEGLGAEAAGSGIQQDSYAAEAHAAGGTGRGGGVGEGRGRSAERDGAAAGRGAVAARRARGSSVDDGDERASADGWAARQEASVANEVLAALDHFNGSAQRERIISITGTLGGPTLTLCIVDGGEPEAGRYVLVAAWELCWYRWSIELDRPGSEVALLGKGYELSELSEAELTGNCELDRRGRLVPYAG